MTRVGVKKEVKDIGHVTIEIKKEVEVIYIPFKMKKEVEELEKVEIVQKKVDLNGILKLIQEYTVKYSKYLYCNWVKSIVPQVSSLSSSMSQILF